MLSSNISTSQIDLALQAFSQQFSINRNVFDYMRPDNTKIQSYVTEYCSDVMIRFEHRVYCGKPQKETHEVKYPAGWWNAFKAAYPRLCRWFRPVEYVTVKVSWEGRVAFPELAAQTKYQTVVVWNSPSIEELR